MTTFLAFTVVGIVVGCVYALTASGLVVTYTTSGIFNFAHGAIGMVAAFTYWQLSVAWHWPDPLALLAVLFVFAPLLGALVERVLIRPLHGAPVDLALVVTLGLLLALIGAADLIWVPTEPRVLPEFFAGHSLSLFGVEVTYGQLVVVAVAAAIAVGLRLFFSRTRTGIAMRAVVDDPDLAAMNGVKPARIQQMSWALGASLASLAGILLAPLVTLDALLLTLLVINGYAAAMVGRLKNLPLTVAGALALGLGSTYAVGYLPVGSMLSKIQLAIPMIFLFVVLIALRQERLRTAGVAGKGVPRAPSVKQSAVAAALLIVVTAAISGFLSPLYLATGARTFALGFVLLSLVLLTGYGGLVSLCQLTFVGLGAFAMGTVGQGGSLLGVLAAVALAAAAGALLAAPTLKLRGLYLALATLAFASAMDSVFFTQVLGSGGNLAVDRVALPLISTESPRVYFVLMAAVFAVAGVGMIALRRGPFGRRLAALNDSSAACATLGLNINWTKLAVFTLAAGMAGLGGVLLAGVTGQVSNNDFALLQSLALLLILRIGGVHTVTGALFGGVFFALFPVLGDLVPGLSNLQYLLTGLAAITLGRDPNGIGGRIADVGENLRHQWRSARTVLAPAFAGAPSGTVAHPAETEQIWEEERA